MASLKRTLSSTRLSTRKSEANSQVTLFELSEESKVVVDPSPRQSKRVKVEPKEEEIVKTEQLDGLEVLERKTARTRMKRRDGAPPLPKAEPSAAPSPPPVSPVKRDVKSPKKVKRVPEALDTPHPAPENWREVYDTIKAMRSKFVAPVDTMGCAEAKKGETEPKNKRYVTLVSLMLSSQTKDEVTDAAVKNLRTAFGGEVSLDAMLAADEATISQAINKVGFWRRKTEYLKKAALMLRDNFNSDIPQTVDELCSLPGVGPKMAILTLQAAWGMNVGIGVDVHVHRITNLLGWHKPETKTPEQTRLNLQSWLPKELHNDINHMLVGFGQVICQSNNTRCDLCDLSTKGLCPSAREVSMKKRKEIVFIKPEDVKPKIEIAIEEEETKFVPPKSEMT